MNGLSDTYWGMRSDEPQVQNVSLFAWRSFATDLHHLFMHSGLNFTNITANMTIEGVEAAASYSNHLYMMCAVYNTLQNAGNTASTLLGVSNF